MVQNHWDLDVYQNALQLAVDIHEFCKCLPSEERYSLADQMRRASRSVCANIAEAWRKRRYRAAFVSKLSDAETEAAETQCWLDISLRLAYMTSDVHADLDARHTQVISQLVNMIANADSWLIRQS